MGISKRDTTMAKTKTDIGVLADEVESLVKKLEAKYNMIIAIADRPDVLQMMAEINGFDDDQSPYYIVPASQTTVHQHAEDELAEVITEFQGLGAKTLATTEAYRNYVTP